MDNAHMEMPLDAFVVISDRANTHVAWMFPNGYGASLIVANGRPEVAVVVRDDSEHIGYRLVYDTPVTDDVQPITGPEHLLRVLNEVRDLPALNAKE